VQPLRSNPIEALTAKPGVRDLGPAVLSNGTLYLGSPTGNGGPFALDPTTGKPNCTFSLSTSTAPHPGALLSVGHSSSLRTAPPIPVQ
jgi:outer membrane protein assembly factor BamB